jgi:hypothetical protein
MLHETGCIHCGKKKFDSVKGSDLCFKHYRQYNSRITKKCKDDGYFDNRYQIKKQRNLVKDHWTDLEVKYYELKNQAYVDRLREQTRLKLA